jgi:ankyrin repeat protein
MPNTSLILFHALRADDYDTFIKKIFNYHSLINTTNQYGESLLHHCSYYGLIEQYYALINIGADIQKTKDGNTLLHYASLSGKDDFLITELVKLGLSPLDKNSFGETALHCSANERISHYLNMWCLRNNIKVDELFDDDLNTVAHSCKIHGNIDGSYYWINNYPSLIDKKNIFNKSWQQCKKKKFTNGLY